MDWLYRSGYQTVGLEEWLAARAHNGQALPRKPVVITFDDGYQDNYKLAWPVLQQYSFRATIFLVSGLIGKCSEWREVPFSKTPMIAWDQVREMAQNGIGFGSHTRTHSDLTQLDAQSIERELRCSRNQIEQEAGRPVRLFSYPYSRLSATIKQQVLTAGYRAAFTYRPWYVGRAGQDQFELQRIGILSSDTIDEFAAKMQGSPRKRVIWYRRQLGQWLKRPGLSLKTL